MVRTVIPASLLCRYCGEGEPQASEFFAAPRECGRPVERIRAEVADIAAATGMSLGEFRRIVNMVQKGEREARIAKKKMVEGQPPPGDLDRHHIRDSP